jgi:hypothetical protein
MLKKNKDEIFSCKCDCGKIYTTIGNLSRHQKKCTVYLNNI